MANSRYLRLSSMAFTVISASSDAIKKDFFRLCFLHFPFEDFFMWTPVPGSSLRVGNHFFWFDARIKYVILNMST